MSGSAGSKEAAAEPASDRLMLKAESPQLAVRKGGNVIQIRVLNGLKAKPFNLAQEKAKEAALGKAAAARI